MRNNLKKTLSGYTVKNPPRTALEETKQLVLAQTILKSVPPFYPARFLKTQLRFLRLSFWVFTTAYLAVAVAVSVPLDASQAVITLCTLTPFLTVAAAPSLFYNRHPQSFELESSCLYTPKTVLAAKMTLCGLFDLFAVIIGSVLCTLFCGARLELTLLLGLVSFTASSLITLTACVFTKTQNGILICFGLFCLIFGLVAGNTAAQVRLASSPLLPLFLLLLLFSALLISMVKVVLNRSNYERLDTTYEY